MKIFTDYNGETEILSDSYPITEVFDGCGYEVQSALLNKGGETIDIGCGNAFGEPKEEEKEEVEQVNNILDTFSYQEQTFDKAGYVTYIKTYMKDLREYLEKNKPARLEAFKKGTAEMVKWILANFDTFTLYLCPHLATATRSGKPTSSSSLPTPRRREISPPSSTSSTA